MTGADTNLIVRYLVRDDHNQADRVLNFLKSGETLYINEVVLCELYWVLTTVYNYPESAFVRAVDALLETEGFQFFNAGVVKASLADYIHTPVGFTDCLIHRINTQKALKTVTFDKRASELSEMILL